MLRLTTFLLIYTLCINFTPVFAIEARALPYDPLGYWRIISPDSMESGGYCLGNRQDIICAFETHMACLVQHTKNYCQQGEVYWKPPQKHHSYYLSYYLKVRIESVHPLDTDEDLKESGVESVALRGDAIIEYRQQKCTYNNQNDKHSCYALGSYSVKDLYRPTSEGWRWIRILSAGF